MNLYEITQEAQYLAALLETEELTPELEAELLINQEQLQIKGINYQESHASKRNREDRKPTIQDLTKKIRGCGGGNTRGFTDRLAGQEDHDHSGQSSNQESNQGRVLNHGC